MNEILYCNVISEQEITEALRFLEKPKALEEQQQFVATVKRKEAIRNLIVTVIGSAIGFFLAYVIFLFALLAPASAPRSIVFFFFFVALVIALGTVLMILRAIYRIAKAFVRLVDIHRDRLLEEVCLSFYETAYCKKLSTWTMASKEEQLLDVCGTFPRTVLQKYNHRWPEVGKQWEECRQQVLRLSSKFGAEAEKWTEDKALKLRNWEVKKSPRDNPRIVDITVVLEVESFGRVAFQNVAVNAGENWFLMSPEPGEQAANR